MLFAISGYFTSGAEAERDAIHERFNAHLAQRVMHVRYGGPLYDAAGTRAGVLLILEARSFAEAESFLHASPYAAAGLYARTEISELRPEVGDLR